MTRFLTIIALLTFGGSAVSQTVGPVQAPANFLPNYFNRSTQPLSPYLNLFRGLSPSVDYYFGVRPGLPSGGQPFPGARTNPYYASPGSPFAFQYSPLPADAGLQTPSQGYVIPPAGHVNTYGNYFGIAGNSLPGYGANRGSAVPGIANSRPQGGASKSGKTGRNP